MTADAVVITTGTFLKGEIHIGMAFLLIWCIIDRRFGRMPCLRPRNRVLHALLGLGPAEVWWALFEERVEN